MEWRHITPAQFLAEVALANPKVKSITVLLTGSPRIGLVRSSGHGSIEAEMCIWAKA